MRFLKLQMHLIPIVNILRVSRELVDDEYDETLQYENTFIHFKDGTCIEVEEENFDEVCGLLNPIPE